MKRLAIQRGWCKGCGICVAFCPKKVLGIDQLEGKVRIDNPDACIYCRLCELRCPDLAIEVKEGPEESEVSGPCEHTRETAAPKA